MTPSELKPLFVGMVRLWIDPKDWEAYDAVREEWCKEFKELSLASFTACVQHLRKTFKPTWGEKFPTPARIWEAQAALSQEVAKVEPEDPELESDPKYREYERLLEEVRRLPPDKYSALIREVKPRVKAKTAGLHKDKEIADICEKALFPGEMVRAYCEQTGRECPI